MQTQELEAKTHLPEDDFKQFAARMPGKVVLPTDAEYETARLGWNRILTKCPDAVVFVETAQDASDALIFARDRKLAVIVQGTGHRETVEGRGSIMIDTSRMNEVRIDPRAQTAWLGAGAKWGDVLPGAQEHGLAPLLGSSTDVGAVGYTLSGGLGWLARKYGMSVDSVLSLEVVTPDGVIRRASPDENSDLFWALSGGGGGFGVVTGMEIRLHPVSTVYAGNLFYPPHMAKEIFQRYRPWVENMPEEMTCSIVLFNFPPLPELPPHLSGQSFVLVRGCYLGPVEEGEKMMAYWRDWQAPLIDDFKARPFAESDVISMDPVDPFPVLLSGEWLSDLNDEAAAALIEHTLPQGGPPLFIFSEVRLAGGAIARVDPQANAFSHRDQRFIWYSVALVLSPEMGEQIQRQLLSLRAALGPNLSGKVYMNFLEGEEMRQRTRDGYSAENFQRLQALKARYDPDYRFISSFDIPPAA